MDAGIVGSRSQETKQSKILFVINSPVIGGAERHTFALSDHLQQRGFGTRIFAMKDGAIPLSERPDVMRPAPGTGLRDRIAQLGGELRDGCYDLVVGVNERPIAAAFFARRLARRRPAVVGVLHSTVLRNWREYLLQFIHFPVFHSIDGLIFISENQRRFWHGRGLKPRCVVTIHNGVDIDAFSPSRREALRAETRARLNLHENDYVLALCAVFRPEKNHLQLLDAIAALRRQGVSAKALLIGDGPLRGAIEQRSMALGIADAVVTTGLTKDVRPFLAAADVGVNCSRSIETLSLSALETLAMGAPMVMSDIGGASEILDANNGRLFPVGDNDGFLAALNCFLDKNVRAAAGRSARATIVSKFDQREMVSAYADHFRDVIGSARQGTPSAPSEG